MAGVNAEPASWRRGSIAEFDTLRKIAGDSSFKALRGNGNLEPSAITEGIDAALPSGQGSSQATKPSYKEALVRGPSPHSHSDYLSRAGRDATSAKCARLARLKLGRRCYKCLARDHFVAACRDPVRCFVCGNFGHRASQCSRHKTEAAPRLDRGMDRGNHRRGRVHSLKAFVPYTEEFLRRTELKRNAILVDVVQPADLGPDPQQTLADALARRFGGYSQDSFVSRFRECDFAIILPGWASAETLIRRHLITLEATWLRCYAWGPNRNARPHRSRFTAWIHLRNVPFECWTPARIASLVCGFGRFIRADDSSKNMTDLRAYRCRVAIDDVQEIPHRLALVMGDEVVDIFIHIESSERVRDAGDQLPPPPPPPITPVDAPGVGAVGPREDGSRIEDLEGGGEGGGADFASAMDGFSAISAMDGFLAISAVHVPDHSPKDDDLPLSIVVGGSEARVLASDGAPPGAESLGGRQGLDPRRLRKQPKDGGSKTRGLGWAGAGAAYSGVAEGKRF